MSTYVTNTQFDTLMRALYDIGDRLSAIEGLARSSVADIAAPPFETSRGPEGIEVKRGVHVNGTTGGPKKRRGK